MKKIRNNNSGFTLIELIIAMAVLAFLMTAVGTLMGSSVLSHRKSKAEINVHTSAQATYNQISDSIMQAKEIVLIGYEVPMAYDFSEPGADAGTKPNLVYYVKNQEMKDYILARPTEYGTTGATDANVKFFKDFGSGTFYVYKLVVLSAAPIDTAYVTVVNQDTNNITLANGISGSHDTLKKLGTADNGTALFSGYDNVISTYTFEKNCMYFEKKYSYMTALNDVINPAVASSKEAHLYNDGFSYVNTSDGTNSASIAACTAKVDANNGSIGIEFQFDDMNMTYTTNGMVNIRNSYVLKGKDD